MSSQSASADSPPKRLERLFPRIHDLLPILDTPDEFVLRDINADKYRKKTAVRLLRDAGAISVVGERLEDDAQFLVYRWDSAARERLETYVDEMDTLPCGCREHVPADMGSGDECHCSHCGEVFDEERLRAFLTSD